MNSFAGLSCAQALDLVVARHGAREALVFGARRWSFAQAREEIDRASARLASLGLARQDKVALWMTNRPEFIWYWLGAAQMGLVAVLLNTRLTAEETAYQLRQSDSRAVLVPGPGAVRDFLGELATICPGVRDRVAGNLACEALPELRHAICVDPPGADLPGVTDWSAFDAPAGTPIVRETDPAQPALIVYSSGTTALPKGVALTHVVWRKAADHGGRFDQTEADRLYLCVPLFGILGNVNGVLTCWTRGSTVVLEDRFDAGEALRTLQDERCTFAYLMPVMVEKLLEHPERARFDISALRSGTIVSNDPALMRRTIVDLGVRELYATYGMSETSSVVLRTRGDDPLEVRLETHGRPMPDIEVRIADPESNEPLPDGQVGEIQVRGYCVTPGYYRKPDETRACAAPDGWFKTGDAGVRRGDGNFRFLSRLKDGYKHNGFNVSTTEVESVLHRHPAVAAAAVVSLPRSTVGEIGVAFVVPRAGAQPQEAELQAFLRPVLAAYKRPHRILFVAELPLTAGTGKVQKFRLRETAREALGD